MNIIVTGANGQLGNEMRIVTKDSKDKYIFTDVMDASEESIAIVALFHDVCKINCYTKEKRWKKDEQNNWETYYTYAFNEQEKYGGHGSKSVFIIQSYMHLSFEEATAINCHMGPNGNDFSCMDAYRECPLAFLLHTADMASTVYQLNTQTTE